MLHPTTRRARPWMLHHWPCTRGSCLQPAQNLEQALNGPWPTTAIIARWQPITNPRGHLQLLASESARLCMRSHRTTPQKVGGLLSRTHTQPTHPTHSHSHCCRGRPKAPCRCCITTHPMLFSACQPRTLPASQPHTLLDQGPKPGGPASGLNCRQAELVPRWTLAMVTPQTARGSVNRKKAGRSTTTAAFLPSGTAGLLPAFGALVVVDGARACWATGTPLCWVNTLK